LGRDGAPTPDRYKEWFYQMLGGGGPVDDARVVVVARLRARRGELVQAIFTRVRGDAFDRVGDDDAEYVAGLRAAVVAALEYVFTEIERGGQGAGVLPGIALEQARRAARVGVSLDTVLRRYVVGSALLGECVMEEADRGDWDGWALGRRGALREVLGRRRRRWIVCSLRSRPRTGTSWRVRAARRSSVGVSGCGRCSRVAWAGVGGSTRGSAMTSVAGISG
jgi:hypothetical protein